MKMMTTSIFAKNCVKVMSYSMKFKRKKLYPSRMQQKL